MQISSIQKDILIGTILGDAYLQKTGEKNARLRLEHGVNQKDYLFWKVKNLQKLFQGKPSYLERIHPVSGNTYKYWRHQSQSMPLLGKLKKIFYKNGKKRIPDTIEKYLTLRSLAVWYMDDGYYYGRDKCSYLYLGNTSEKEAECARSAFERRFNLKTKVLAKKKGFALYFPPQEVLKLKSLIHKYVLDQFNYKLPL